MLIFRRFVFLVLVGLSLFGQAPPLLDEWVARVQQQFEVPGVAIGIVIDGQLVVAKGFGVRKLGQGRLEHFQQNTFIVRWNDNTIPCAYCNFQLGVDGKVESLKMETIHGLADFSFDFQDLDFKPVPRK